MQEDRHKYDPCHMIHDSFHCRIHSTSVPSIGLTPLINGLYSDRSRKIRLQPYFLLGDVMFGTMGFSELIIILVIVLIIFGAGKLPQIGEGVGKALKGFKKEVNDIPPPMEPPPSEGQDSPPPHTMASTPTATPDPGSPAPSQPAPQAYQPGPERTPGTLAAQVYGGFGPEVVQPPASPPPPGSQPVDTPAYQEQYAPPTMEQRAEGSVPRPMAQYPPLPQSAIATPGAKRPATVVNKEAVARVQAQRAAIQKAKGTSTGAPSPNDMQSLGEGLGGALRTFREAAADVKNSIDPEMRTIQAELDAAQKEVEQTVQIAKESPFSNESPPSST